MFSVTGVSAPICNMAGLPRKRHFEEVDRLDLLTKPLPNASLHGAVTSLSKVKEGRNSSYFDGTLYDGCRQVRLVGFLPAQQKKLDGFCTKKKPVAFKNCEVKQSRQGGDEMDIILKSSTEITESPRSLDASVFNSPQPVTRVITLSELGSTKNYKKVITNIKVLTSIEPICLAGGKKKQDVTIGDQTGTSKVTLWGDHIDSLVLQCSYKLKNFVVREYA